MQVTISRPDNIVTLDQEGLPIDCGALSPLIRVVQWNDEAAAGHIEFMQTPGQPFIRNVKIVEFHDYEYLRDAFKQRLAAVADAAKEVERLTVAIAGLQQGAKHQKTREAMQQALGDAVLKMQDLKTKPRLAA